MATNIAKINEQNNLMRAETVEKVLLQQDLAALNPKEKVEYIKGLSESLGLNFLSTPFQLIKFQGKEKLYATKDCTEQLRKINNISISIIERRLENEIYIVVAKATSVDGRSDEASGAVPFPANLTGEARANAIMKCETKAKRRVTLSICGLGILDESELDTMPAAKIVNISVSEPEKPLKQIENTGVLDKEAYFLEMIQTAQTLDELKDYFNKARDYAKQTNDKVLYNKYRREVELRKFALENPHIISPAEIGLTDRSMELYEEAGTMDVPS
jgi:hypothetical protein